MYCTPCARLMKSITPKTSVRPAATRKSSTPNCRPLRACTSRSWTVMNAGPADRGLRRPAARSGHRTVPSAHAALGRPGVGVVLQHAAHRLGLELAVGAPGHLAQPEILHRVVVGAELEIAADGAEIRRPQRRPQRVLVAEPAAD